MGCSPAFENSGTKHNQKKNGVKDLPALKGTLMSRKNCILITGADGFTGTALSNRLLGAS